MSISEIIQEIEINGYEEEVMQILLQKIFEDNRRCRDERAEYRASLIAIKKINNKKNDDIDALCEL